MNRFVQLNGVYRSIFGSDLLTHWNNEESTNQYAQIRTSTYSPQLNGHIPHKKQSIIGIYSLIQAMHSLFDEIVVFAIDSISYDYFAKSISNQIHLSNYATGILSSVFPSTTGSAWHSIIYGATPSQTGAYGTSFLHEMFNQNYVWIGNTLSHKGVRTSISPEVEVKINLSDNLSLFELSKQSGFDSYYYGTHGVGLRNPFRDELTRGAAFEEPMIPNYDHLKAMPLELLDYFLNKISYVLNNKKARKLIWNYINLDAYIHNYGYKALDTHKFWEVMFNYWKDNQQERRAFIMISDHGQTPQTRLDFDILKSSAERNDLKYNTGGAGRTLYFYPYPEKTAAVKSWLLDVIGDSGLVLSKDDLVKIGLIEEDAKGFDRIGDIIAIAKSCDFPSAGACEYLNEHGALTPEEMFVPFVISF